MERAFAAKGITLVAVEKNPVDTVWQQCGRPSVPCKPLLALDISKTGKSHQDKIATVQEFIRKNGAVAFLAPALDDVAWLLNIRGDDVQFNPVALSYAVVTLDKTYLFVDPNKVTPEVHAHLGANVVVRPYEEVKAFLVQQAAAGKVVMDPAQVNWSLYSCVGEAVLPRISPIILAKSLKNATELEGFRQCHIRDGAALTAFFCWLEQYVLGGGKITEHEVTLRIEEFRARMKDHKGPSFGTIAAYGPNGAMMHYSPAADTSATLDVHSTFLCDSGAQYLDGTTDVTRYVLCHHHLFCIFFCGGLLTSYSYVLRGAHE
jgi:Xaa-Pro aminopeptidase